MKSQDLCPNRASIFSSCASAAGVSASGASSARRGVSVVSSGMYCLSFLRLCLHRDLRSLHRPDMRCVPRIADHILVIAEAEPPISQQITQQVGVIGRSPSSVTMFHAYSSPSWLPSTIWQSMPIWSQSSFHAVAALWLVIRPSQSANRAAWPSAARYR